MDPKISPPADSNSPNNSVVICAAETENKQKMKQSCCPQLPSLRTPTRVIGIVDNRRLVHATKVSLALVLVSLLYMLEVVHERLGDNAMWAVMTVVVVFEFTSGATISKGLNRGVGTILGGGLGSLVALLAQEISGAGKAVAIGASVFVFGAAATYIRMVPSIKKKYDYGALIFILTFSLVAVSGVRGDQIIKIASDRLSSICIGFAICLFISLFIFPVWSGDELHNSLASKFDKLAHSIEDCLEDYMSKPLEEKMGTRIASYPGSCLSVLSSKTADETLANFAKWEPWHGRFGFYHPWHKYLQIGELLQELAASIISMKGCLRYEQASPQYETACSFLASTLRELGDNIYRMKKYQQGEIVTARLRTIRFELCSPMPVIKPATVVNQKGAMGGKVPTTSSLFLLGEIVDKVEELVKEVDGLGKIAGFSDQ